MAGSVGGTLEIIVPIPRCTGVCQFCRKSSMAALKELISWRGCFFTPEGTGFFSSSLCGPRTAGPHEAARRPRGGGPHHRRSVPALLQPLPGTAHRLSCHGLDGPVWPRHSSGGCYFSGVDAVCALFRGPVCFSMAQRNCRLLNWNVRGLNDGARQDTVNELVRDTGSTIVCLQETKLQLMDQRVVTRTVGSKFANSFAVLPAAQTRGGILLAVNEDYFDLSNTQLTTNAITTTITMRADGTQWQMLKLIAKTN